MWFPKHFPPHKWVISYIIRVCNNFNSTLYWRKQKGSRKWNIKIKKLACERNREKKIYRELFSYIEREHIFYTYRPKTIRLIMESVVGERINQHNFISNAQMMNNEWMNEWVSAFSCQRFTFYFPRKFNFNSGKELTKSRNQKIDPPFPCCIIV